MRERDLIKKIREMATGIGDDCAVWRPGPRSELIVTTDQLVEGVHYLFPATPARAAGARLVGRGLSDIAAMGGEARLVFLNVAWPASLPDRWRLGFLRGFATEAKRWKVAWAGGDVSGVLPGSGPVASITAIGEVPRGRAILRSGARPGDIVYVTGKLGAAPGAAQARITPRLAVGRKLRGVASAAMDLSDGLSTDLHHLAEESGVGAIIEASRIPVASTLKDAVNRALNRGEDYELLFTARKSVPAKIAGIPITAIGRVTRQRKLWIEDATGRRSALVSRGWQH